MENIISQLEGSIGSARTLEQLTRPLLEMLESVTGLESTYLTAIDLEVGLQHIIYARNSRQLQIPEGLSVPWDDTLCKRAIEEGRTYTDDVASCWGDSEAARALGIKTYVSTPVRAGEGDLYGTLCAASSSQVPLSPASEKVLGLFAKLIGQHVEREQLLGKLQKANAELAASAIIDPLTGLPNRLAAVREGTRMLANARRNGYPIVVAFVDLDGFKSINDRFGHSAGDELLAAIGKKLLACLRAGDLVTRFGGDEFLVIAPIPSEAAEESVETIRSRLHACTVGRYPVGSGAIDYLGASVGVALSGADGTSLEDLIKQADASMYRDKRHRSAQPPMC